MKKISISDTALANNILNKAVEVFNIPEKKLKGKSRYQNIQLVRTAISNIGRFEYKIHYETLGDAISRDRSSIYHYERHHEIWYSNWKPYQRTYDKLFLSLGSTVKPSLNKCHIKRLLKAAGITTGLGKIVIIISSCTTSHTITTDSFEFSGIIEKIKETLKDFSYTLDMKI